MTEDDGFLEVAFDFEGRIARVVLPDGGVVTEPQSFDRGYTTASLVLTQLEAVSLIYFRPHGQQSTRPSIALFGGRRAAEPTRKPEIRAGESITLAFDGRAKIAGVTLASEIGGDVADKLPLTGVDVLLVSSFGYYDASYLVGARAKRHRCVGSGGHVYW